MNQLVDYERDLRNALNSNIRDLQRRGTNTPFVNAYQRAFPGQEIVEIKNNREMKKFFKNVYDTNLTLKDKKYAKVKNDIVYDNLKFVKPLEEPTFTGAQSSQQQQAILEERVQKLLNLYQSKTRTYTGFSDTVKKWNRAYGTNYTPQQWNEIFAESGNVTRDSDGSPYVMEMIAKYEMSRGTENVEELKTKIESHLRNQNMKKSAAYIPPSELKKLGEINHVNTKKRRSGTTRNTGRRNKGRTGRNKKKNKNSSKKKT